MSTYNISSVWKDPVLCLRQRALKRIALLSPASNCFCLQHIRKVLKREEAGEEELPFHSWQQGEAGTFNA